MIKIIKKIIYFASILVLAISCYSLNIGNSKFNRIDKITKKYMENRTIPGSVVLVSKNGRILYHKAMGYAQVIENGHEYLRKMKKDTMFDIASLTKIFSTTQAVMKLVSEGKLDVNEKVCTYIPEFAQNGKENVKVKDLLTHTSGLTPWVPTFYFAKNRENAYKYIFSLGLEYETGSNRKYSDLSFMTLAKIVENITGKKINEYVESKIYDKLGLKRTTYLPLAKYDKSQIASTSHGNPFEKRMVEDDSFGYKIEVDKTAFNNWRNYTLTGEVNDGNAYYGFEGVAGHAGLYSTAYELYKLGEVVLNGGKSLYSKEVVDEFTRVQSPFGHGYGYEINRGGEKKGYMGKYANKHFVGHTGFTGTQIVYDLKNKIQVIILTNKQNYGTNENTQYKSTWPYAREVMEAVGDILYKK